MKKSFFIIIAFILFGCRDGKNHHTLQSGKFFFENEYFTDELFEANDSLYYIRKWDSTGNVCRIDRAKTKKDYDDSTFIMTLYFKNGHKDTWLKLEHGKKVADSAWYENGTLMLAGTFSNGKRDRYEWGTYGQRTHWTYDLAGNGMMEEFYSNGVLKDSGPRKNYQRTGAWKRQDSLGNKLADTIYP